MCHFGVQSYIHIERVTYSSISVQIIAMLDLLPAWIWGKKTRTVTTFKYFKWMLQGLVKLSFCQVPAMSLL